MPLKSYDDTCINTLVRTPNVIDNVYVNNECSNEILLILKAINSHFKGHMINRTLHPWSLQIKFVKWASGKVHELIWNDHSSKIHYLWLFAEAWIVNFQVGTELHIF